LSAGRALGLTLAVRPYLAQQGVAAQDCAPDPCPTRGRAGRGELDSPAAASRPRKLTRIVLAVLRL